MKKAIYLDHHATTPVAPQVFEAMAPYFCEHFGNPSSTTHSYGWKADMAVAKARKQLADLIGAKPSEIFFTSGATEANNWAARGLLAQAIHDEPRGRFHILTSNVEHSCNLAVFAKAAEHPQVELSILKADRYGQIHPEQIKKELRPHSLLISIIFGNNEIGSINPVAEIGELAQQHGIYFHSDGAQCLGRVPVDVNASKIHLLSMASHKMYGPKGVGALYIRSANPKVQIQPLLEGGGQERGLRSGTLNVPGIVGMGEAARLSHERLEADRQRLLDLSNYLLQQLKGYFPKLKLNGHPTERLCNNLNVTIPELNIERLLPRLSHIAVSTGSACASGTKSMSHVLEAIGLSPEDAKRTIRFGLGRGTTRTELDQVVREFSEVEQTGEISQ